MIANPRETLAVLADQAIEEGATPVALFTTVLRALDASNPDQLADPKLGRELSVLLAEFGVFVDPPRARTKRATAKELVSAVTSTWTTALKIGHRLGFRAPDSGRRYGAPRVLIPVANSPSGLDTMGMEDALAILAGRGEIEARTVPQPRKTQELVEGRWVTVLREGARTEYRRTRNHVDPPR